MCFSFSKEECWMVCWSLTLGGPLSAWTSSHLPSSFKVSMTAVCIVASVPFFNAILIHVVWHLVNRELGVPNRHRLPAEESPAPLNFIIISFVLLPGHRSSHSCTSFLWKNYDQPHIGEQSLLRRGSRQTQRYAVNVSAYRSPTLLYAAEKETFQLP